MRGFRRCGAFTVAGLMFLFLLRPISGFAQKRAATQSGPPAKGRTEVAGAVAAPGLLPPIEVPFVSAAPAIDGALGDEAWKGAALALGEWVTYNPAYGEHLEQKTSVWIGYDRNNLYVAFRCLDPEPRKIKTSIARRDTLWNDDWIGLSLDALGSRQSSYDLFVNPSGIQGDILNSSTAGEDSAPDWVWYSAGRVTEEGYEAEMRIPLKSIRFRSGREVRMGVIFWRRVSRLGMSASWPDLPRGSSIFTRYAPLLLRDLKEPLTLEAIPNATYSLRQNREAPGRWAAADSELDGGITVKYGITSSVTLDGTYRPDFSQVESDAYQVEVNQRYPVFYSEKRPFFMEGMGTFQLAGAGGDGNLRTAVHTRRIVDPLFGLKLSGNLGKFTFATLSASDRAPGQLDGSNPYAGDRKEFNIARALYGLGQGDYVGGLLTDTEFGGGHNRVAAADVSMHVGDHQQWNATAIGSDSVDPAGGPRKQGMAGQFQYFYNSKRYESGIQIEHYDANFQMDTAFYNRTGVSGGWVYSAINLYPDPDRFKWFKKVNTFVFVRGYRDRLEGGNDRLYLLGIRMFFTRQGFLRLHYYTGKEPWTHRLFDIRGGQVQAQTQLYGWLNLYGNVNFSRSIYYDRVQPFPGHEVYLNLGLVLQPDSRLNENISFTRDVFDRLSGGPHVFAVNILNTRTSYQINKRLSARAIARYDSSRARVLTDFLGSYELVPGTVAYAGYGSLFERTSWDGEQLVRGPGEYLNTQRGLFFKVSYLHRF